MAATRALIVALVAAVLAAPALGATGDPRAAHTAAGGAVAQKALLKKSDFSKSWKATPAAKTQPNSACKDTRPNLSDLTEVGYAESSDFALGQLESVSQVVRVYKSPQQAKTAYSRTVTIGLVSCLANQLRSASTSKATVTVTGQARLPLPKVAQQADGFRVSARTNVKAEKEQFDVFAYVVVLRQGATITTISIGSFTAPGDALASQLARIVGSRLGGKPAGA